MDLNGNISLLLPKEEYTSRLSPEADFVFAFFMAAIIPAIILSNAIGLRMFWNRRKKLLPIEYLLFHLCVMNILTSFVDPFIVIAAIKHKWIFGEFACNLEAVVIISFAMSHLTSIILIAVLRYAQICRGLRITKRTALKVIPLTYLTPITVLSPPIFGIAGKFGPEIIGFSCCIQWYGVSGGDQIYIGVACAICLILPTIVIFYCYGSIYKFVANAKQTLGRQSAIPDAWVTKMSACMVAGYGICWTPYGINVIYTTITGDLLLPLQLSFIPLLTATTSYAVTPIIYIILNHSYKTELQSLLTSKGNSIALAQQSNCETIPKVSGAVMSECE